MTVCHKGIYELTEFQHSNLVTYANGPSIVFALLEPNESDSQEGRDKLLTEAKELRELIALGLLEDVSEKFKEPIELSRLNRNRGYAVFALTKDSLTLFRKCEERLVN